MAPNPARDELRQRVLDELALVQGRVALASNLDPASAKEQLRLAHGSQRRARLDDAAEFLQANEDQLIAEYASGDEINPAAIDPVVVPVRTPGEANLFRFATLQWSVPVSAGYGRRTRFLVRDRQNGKLVAIFALGDPVIAQSARDGIIGWTKDQRHLRLYNVYDAFVLGAVEPYRQLLGGKLAALLTLSDEVRTFLTDKYRGSTTEINEAVKNPTPALITTSSALGRSSVYNRVTYRGSLMFHSVGFTRGFGHFQFSDGLFADLRTLVSDNATENEAAGVLDQSNRFGKGANWRLRVIRNALELLDLDAAHLQHNVRREVFLAPAAANWDQYLRGETDHLDEFDLPAAEIGAWYRDRWAIGRAERRPAFRFWRRDEGRLAHTLADQPVQLGLSGLGRAPHGVVDLGSFRLAVGTAKKTIHGKSQTGIATDGTAYMSRLEGPDVTFTLADITWATGERELRGWSRHDSDLGFEDVIGRLRIGVYPAHRYDGMSTIELRPAARSSETSRATARQTTVEALTDLLGFDLADALDGVGDATIGTRAELLRDEGRRRRQLCAVFNSSDVVLPALVWSLMRPVPLIAAGGGQLPSMPTVGRQAPKPDELGADNDAPSAA